jgi:DNA-binding SARP family transcriptional activator
LGAILGALVLFGATPAVLWFLVGDPMTHGHDHQSIHPIRDMLSILTLVAWVAWVACCLGLIRSVLNHLEHGNLCELADATLTDRLGARIAAGIMTITALGVPLSMPNSAEASSPSSPASSVLVPHSRADLVLGRPRGDIESAHVTSARNSKSPPQSSEFGEIIVLGLGAIGCAALARRSRRLRLLRQLSDHGGAPPPSYSDEAIDCAVGVEHGADRQALRAFERANCELDRVMRQSSASLTSSRFCAVCVGATDVTFWLAEPTRVAPDGFTLEAEGRAWRLDLHDVPEIETAPPHLPVALNVGEDVSGTWLVPLQPGDCIPILGSAADALWRSARTIQESWAWSELVHITSDPAVVEREVRQMSSTAMSAGAYPRVLFFGDPTALPPALQQSVAIVTTSVPASSDVVLFADQRAVTIHPLGRSIRPHLIEADLAEVVAELATPDPPSGTFADVIGAPEVTVDTPIDAQPTRGMGFATVKRPDCPGQVEVKLLTMTPRIEGLCEPLPPSRARRAVELVAYLALHRPDVVTSDRLRTRVLGTSEADAAPQTLFNVATAARRSLGTDEGGCLLLPPGSRSGYYGISDGVTTDVQRAASLAAIGSATVDPGEAMAYLRAALALVESEPLANALSGFSWWESEGHGARLAAVLVNAASDLAALAVQSGRFDLAQWGLEQARLVEPYSEALTRASMQVAAAAGDADRLRREWRECQRRIDELDPGSSPSPRTERLYGELSERTLVGANGRHSG